MGVFRPRYRPTLGYEPIGCNSSGDNVLVSVSGTDKFIRGLGLVLVAREAVEVYIKSSGGTVIFFDDTYPLKLDPAGLDGTPGFILPVVPNDPRNPIGWFETAPGEDLEINLSAEKEVTGGVVYEELTQL